MAIKSGNVEPVKTYYKKLVSEDKMLEDEMDTRLVLIEAKAEQQRISDQLKAVQAEIGVDPQGMYTKIQDAIRKGKKLDNAPDLETDRLFALRDRARAENGRTSTLKDIAYRANLTKQVSDMVETYSSGGIYEGAVLEDAEPIQQNFTNRVANGTLDVGDGITYETMLSQIENYGEWYDPVEMASAYASGLSTQQYAELVERNRQNAEMTSTQKESLRTYTEFVRTKYNELTAGILSKLPPNAIPQVRTAIYEDQLDVTKIVREGVIEGKPSEDIFTAVEKHFIRDTEKHLKGWFVRKFWHGRANELKETVQAIEGRNERYDLIMDLVKSDDRADKERLRHLMTQWYGE
jgi:hypothetical protein